MRLFDILIARKTNGGGGGGSSAIESLLTDPVSGTIQPISDLRLPHLTHMATHALYQQKTIQTITAPELISAGQYCCFSMSKLRSVDAPKLQNIGQASFKYASVLTTINAPALVSIGAEAFSNCPQLTKITLTGNTVCTLASVNAFENSGITTIEVPASLVDEYKQATNWSVYADKIVAVGG